MRSICALGAVAAFGILTDVSPAAAPAEQAMMPVNAPDVFGGYASTQIVVKARSGVLPRQLDAAHWTFAAEAPAAANQAARRPRQAPVDPVAAAFAARGVTSVKPTFSGPFAFPQIAAKYGLDRFYTVHVPRGTDTPAFVAELAKLGDVFELADLDGIGGIAGIPNDTSFPSQWNMHNKGQTGGTVDADIDAPEAWDITTGSSSYILAIVDTGVQPDHPDLNGKVLPQYSNANTPTPGDPNGHGTHCAGIAAARGNDGIGVAGVNWNVQILPVQVAEVNGASTTAQCADGVNYAVNNGAKTISMSLQYYTDNAALAAAVAAAWDAGVMPVAATGNFKPAGTVAWPAKYPKCMGVGATNNTDAKWSGSNSGPEIDVSAPGENVYSTFKLSGYSTLSGTSMATPHVAGLASLLYSANTSLLPDQIDRILKLTAEDKGAAGFDTLFGHGRVNARKALERAVPTCPGNVNGDGNVDIDDLFAVINSWGPCALCLADVVPAGGDGNIDIDDLFAVINGWGSCP